MIFSDWRKTKKLHDDLSLVTDGKLTGPGAMYHGGYVIEGVRKNHYAKAYKYTTKGGDIYTELTLQAMERVVWREVAKLLLGDRISLKGREWLVDAGPEYSKLFATRAEADEYAINSRRNLPYSPIIVRPQ